MARIDKLTSDTRTVEIDGRPFLREHELIVRVASAKGAAGMLASAKLLPTGHAVRVTFSGGTTGGRPFIDAALCIGVVTTQGECELTQAVRLING